MDKGRLIKKSGDACQFSLVTASKEDSQEKEIIKETYDWPQ